MSAIGPKRTLADLTSNPSGGEGHMKLRKLNQGELMPFDFITVSELGDEINDNKAFAACI
jgi:hypothetical protein